MDKKDQSHEEIKKNRAIFEEIKNGFNKWRSNMYLCTILYIFIFIIAQTVNKHLIKPRAAGWLSVSEILVVALAAIILGFFFIADSIITSHLKTPLQRLNINIERSSIKDKGGLMRITQETNELFKETLKKFGILVIPALIASVIDTKGEMKVVDKDGNVIGKVIEEAGNKRSESALYYICYLIPVLFAT
jgi:hypothetical protein